MSEFKEKCTIENKIVNSLRKDNNILIYVYCLEENMDIDKEK